jgi:hypothetical protein
MVDFNMITIMIYQNVLIGMDIPIYENRRKAGEYNISSDENLFGDDYCEVSNHLCLVSVIYLINFFMCL